MAKTIQDKISKSKKWDLFIGMLWINEIDWSLTTKKSMENCFPSQPQNVY